MNRRVWSSRVSQILRQRSLRLCSIILLALLALLLAGCDSSESTAVLPPTADQVSPGATSTPPPKKRRDPQAVEAITFADLDLPIEPDSEFKEWMLTQRVHDLVDHKVRLRGFMSKGLFQLRNIKEFVLLRDLECCQFGPGSTADHNVQVKLSQGMNVSYTPASVTVEGRLILTPFTGSDGKTWSIFTIEAEKFEVGEE